MVEVRRKDNESIDSLIRRFMNKVRLSGVKSEAMKHRHFTRKQNKRARRVAAKRRAELTDKYDKMRKLGLLDEYTQKNRTFRGRSF